VVDLSVLGLLPATRDLTLAGVPAAGRYILGISQGKERVMDLFGKKPADRSQAGGTPRFTAHPVFTLTAGMSQAAVVDRIGPATEMQTFADMVAEFAGPGVTIDPARLEPEDIWSYANVPDGHHLRVRFSEQRLLEVRVWRNGSQELVARIDDQGVAASRTYLWALRAHRL
jgi:hypothetical protein